MIYRPIVLIVIDGWGISPTWGGNAIAMAKTPVMDQLWREYPHQILQAFRKLAGPTGQISNSEIGHGSIGTGRMIPQDLQRINEAITNGSFLKNDVLRSIKKHINDNNSALHLIGLISDGGIHSSIDHLFALLEFANQHKIKKVYIHAITDGRDAPPISATKYIDQIEKNIARLKSPAKIATIIGRFYAMDKINAWDRTHKTYDCLIKGKGIYANDPYQAVALGYGEKLNDEYIKPTVITQDKKPIATIKDGDGIILFNFRSDRIKQLIDLISGNRTSLFLKPPKNIQIMTLSSLADIAAVPILPREPAKNSLAEIISTNNLKQFHTAESEKYAHVTYFFNGGREQPFPYEDRAIVPSPKVESYRTNPEMSAQKVAENAIKAINNSNYDFIVINFANVDMVSHTGDIIATAKAAEIVDHQIGKIIDSTISSGGATIITADHGHAENMINITKGTPETFHTLSPVPFILVTPNNRKTKGTIPEPVGILMAKIISTPYSLADVAPTILDLMGIEKPAEMTGKTLLNTLT